MEQHSTFPVIRWMATCAMLLLLPLYAMSFNPYSGGFKPANLDAANDDCDEGRKDCAPLCAPAPTALCQNLTVQLGPSGNATILPSQVDNGSFDVVPIVSYSLSQTNFDCNNIGTNTVVLTVTNDNGDASSCTATVMVEDNQAPDIVCPANIQVSNDIGICGGTVSYQYSAGDNCVVLSVTSTAGLPPGSVFPVGTTTNTLVATDAQGNTASCSFTVTVDDAEAPVINCPSSMSVSTYNFPAPTAIDNCPGVIFTQIGGLHSGSNVGPGSTILNTFQATDASGNMSSCSFEVTVLNAGPLDTICQEADTMFLIREDNLSSTVDKCYGFGNQQVPCPPNQPSWGYVQMLEGYSLGTQYVDLNFTLAPGWYSDAVDWSFGFGNSFLFDQNGFPVVGTDWDHLVLNPNQNKWQIRLMVSSLPAPCFDVAVRVEAVRLNLFGAVRPGSQTILWPANSNWNVTGHPAASISPWLMHFCPNNCQGTPPDTTFESVVLNECGTVNTKKHCVTLHPTPTDTGAITYAWSTGDVSQDITVCLQDQATYAVSISVDGIVRHIIVYNVTVNIIPAPLNDNSCQAFPLQPGVALSFSNVCASAEPTEPSPPGGDCNSQTTWCDPTIDNTVWFSFQAPASGCVSLFISNGKGNIDPNFQMALWQADNCGDFVDFELVAANDDGGPDHAPIITEITCLVPGQTYFVQVDGYNGFTGTGVITLVECNSTPLVIGFSTQPVAISNNVDVCLNQPVYFIDSSVGAVSWLWEFGDAYVSAAPSPSHAYAIPGTYTVQLTVADACGNTQTLSTKVTVSPEPGPDIFCPSIVCEGDTAIYSTSAICNTYQWSVAGGTIVSSPLNNDSIAVVWGSGTNGFGTVSLAVPGCGGLCSAPAFRIVPIVPKFMDPTGDIKVCAGNSSTYSLPCIPATTYNWTVDQGGTITAGQGSHDITVFWDPYASGIATITVTYENTLMGCTGEGTIQVKVLQRFQVNGPATACENIQSSPFHAYQLLFNIPASVDWSVVTPANITLPNLQTNSSSFVYDFTDGPGTYAIVATDAQGNYCNPSATYLVEVTATPPPPAIAGDTLVCPNSTHVYASSLSGTGASLLWTITGGTPSTATGSPIDITWDSSGTYFINVVQQTATDPVCDSKPTTLVVNAYPPLLLPALTGDDSLCMGATAQYSFSDPLNPFATYTWSIDPSNLGTITSANGSNNITVQWANTGSQDITAEVVLTVDFCGIQTASFPVALFAKPQPQIGQPTLVCAGQSAAFTGSAAATWAWDFGDGNTSTVQDPIHIYAAAGTYTVTLTVTNAAGCQANTQTTVVVAPVPVIPVITGTQTFCGEATATYTFAAPVSPGATYSWAITPSTAGSILASTNNSVTVHWNAFAGPNNADLLLSISSSCLQTQVGHAVTVNPLPVANFTFPPLVCTNAPVIFSGPIASAYAWTFGDGGTSTLQNPSHTYANAGTFTTTLQVTDANGCTATASASVVVNPTPEIPIITGPNSFCGANAATYAFSQPIVSGANYLWSINPSTAGNIVSGNGSQSISVQWANPSATVNAQVVLNVNSNCLQTQQSFAVTMHPAANAAIGLPTPACAGPALQFSGSSASTWLWAFGDGGTSTQQNPTHAYAASGVYPVQLQLTDANGCTATTNASLTVLPVPELPVITGTQTFCGGATATYSFPQPLTSGASYLWSISPFNAGSILTSSSNSVTIRWNSPSADVAASVLMDIASPCITAQVAFPVTIHALPLVSFSVPTTICTGGPASFMGSGGIAWAWDFGDGGTSSALSPTYTYDTAGNFPVTFTATDTNGCQATASTIVTVYETPIEPVFTGPNTFCGASTATYSFPQPLASFTRYSWSIFPANAATYTGNGTQTISVQWSNPTATQNAVVILNVSSFCLETEQQLPVTLYPGATAEIGIPSVACAGQAAQFTGSAGNAWLWDFGDGGTSNLQNPMHTYASSGTYAIQLQFTDTNGCTAIANQSVIVDEVPVMPIIAGATSNCAGGSSIFSFLQTPAQGASYTWSVVPASAGVPIATGVSNSTQVQWGIVTTPTPVNIVLHVQSTCIDSQVVYPVILYPRPASSFTYTSPNCTGINIPFSGFGGTSWLWNFGDGGTSTLQNPSHTYLAPGYKTVTLQVAENGCSALSEGYVEILSTPQVPVLQGQSLICEGVEGFYSFPQPAAPGVSYAWSVLPVGAGTFTTSNGGNSIRIRWNTAGPNTVLLNVTSDCLDTLVTFPVTVNGAPPISIGHASPICQGAPSPFTGPPASTWSWRFGDGGTSNQQNPFHVYTNVGEFHVSLTITDANGCANFAETDVLVRPSPIARIYGPCDDECMPRRFCTNSSSPMTLTALNGLGYQFAWQPGNFNNTPTATITGPGTYHVDVTNVYGCTASSAPVTLIADPCIPNSCVPEAHVQDFTYALDVPSCTHVNFTYNLSPNTTFDHFEFDDGGTSTQLNPSHDYVWPGTYCPTLVATVPDAMNPGEVCTLRVCHNLIIPVLADFFLERTCGLSGWQVQINDLSNYYGDNVIDVWEWYVDGATTPSATGPYPSLSFTPGSHTLALTVTSTATGATCTKSKTFSLPAGPTADFSFINPTCANTSTVFTNLSSGSVVAGTWDFFNDNTATANFPSHTYAYPITGNFQVALTVTDTNGCKDKKVLPITVVSNAGGQITASGPTTFCNGESVVLTAPAASSYQWSTGATTPSITVTTAGSYNVTLTNSNGCLFTTGSVGVTVRPFPNVAISGSHFYCQGGWINLSTVSSNLQYTWEFDDLPIDGNWVTVGSGTSLLQIPLPNTSASGNYRVTVADFQNVCSITTAPFAVTVDPVPSNSTMGVSGPTAFCQGGSVTLTAPVGASYAWSTGATTQSISVTQTGSYAVTISTVNGCAYGPPPVPVTVYPAPLAVISGPSTYCTGEMLGLQTISGPYDFLWEFDALPIDGSYATAGGNTAALSFLLTTTGWTGNYRVTATDTLSGCALTTAPFAVLVNETPAIPTISASGPLTFCQGNTVTLTASGNGNYLWSTGSTASSIVVSQTGNYGVLALGAGGCQTNSNPIVVTVNPVPTAAISGQNSYCVAELLSLQTTGGPFTFQWEYDDLPINGSYSPIGGSSPLLQQSLTSTAFAGNYRVKVTNPTTGCFVVSADYAVSVNAIPPTPTITASGPTALCQGTSVTLTASGTGNFLWSTGATTQSIVVSQAGNFSVIALGQGTCQATSPAIAVTVLPIPTANITGRSSYCEGELLAIQTNPGPYTFQWAYDPLPIEGTYIPVSGTTSSLSILLSSTALSGNYRVTVTNTSNGCAVTTTPFAVTVNPTPTTPVITASGPVSICQGNSVTLTASGTGTFLWSNGATTPSITLTQSGIFSVVATEVGGCQASSAPTAVTVSPVPPASISGQNSYCTGELLSLFTTAGAYNFAWEYDALPIEGNYSPIGGSSANLQQLLSSPAFTGNYRVKVTDPSSGCFLVSADYLVNVSQNPATPVITASGPLSFCQGNSITLSASPADIYHWSTGATTQSIIVNQSGTFAVTVSNFAGCQAVSPPTSVTVNPLPNATIQGNATYCQGTDLFLQTISGPFTYQWEYDSLPIDNQYVPVGGNSSTLQFLLNTTDYSGNYRVVVTHTTTTCSFTTPVFAVLVNPVPDLPTITVSGPTTLCTGDAVTLTAPPGASYIWSTGAVIQAITVGNSGDFTVTVTTQEGCPFIAGPETVTVHPLPSAWVQGDSVVCSGDLIDLTTAYGPYHYQWELDALPIDGNYAPVGLDASEIQLFATVNLSGAYHVIVTDATTGCVNVSPPFDVLVNPTPIAPIITSTTTGTLCADQTWTLMVTNLEQGATYTWSTGQVGTSIVALAAGEYTVVASFAGGCSATSNTITLSPSPIIECFPSGCYSHCESLGPIEIDGPPGFAFYEWLQEPGQQLIATTQNVSISQTGSYHLRVTNGAGCSATSDLFEITFIDCCSTFAATTVSTDLTCLESSDGIVSVIASGGLEPYAYQWSTGDQTSSIQGQPAGIYIVEVTDQNNCLLVLEDTVYQPDPLEMVTIGTGILCYGDSATYEITATGGTPPYIGTGIYTFAPGFASVTVTDAHGCSVTFEAEITQPDTLVADVTVGTVECQGDSTYAIVTAYGGVPPYTGTGTFTVSNGTHSFVVTDSNDCSTTVTVVVDPVSTLSATATAGTILCNGDTTTVTIGATGGTSPYSGTGTFQVTAGTYTYTVTDANGCTDTILVEIAQPDPMVFEIDPDIIHCHGGTAAVSVYVHGGTPPYSGTGLFFVGAGSHNFTIVDANQCRIDTTLVFAEPDALVATAIVTTQGCNGNGAATVTVTATGGFGPYAGTGTFSATLGNHTYTVTDAAGCTASTSITVTAASPPAVTTTVTPVTCYQGSNGTATAIATGGTPPYTYQWSTTPTQTTATATGLGVGNYSVTVTDALGCSATRTVTITVLTCSGFRTQTQGGWGANPQGNNPATYLYSHFAAAFPSGLTAGCTKTLKLTTTTAVTNFLPSGGTPAALTANLINPTTYSNTLAGQVVALKLSIGFDLADPNFSSSTTLLRDLIIGSGTFAGWTVGQLLAEGEKKLGGCASSYSASTLTNAIDLVNQNYDNGTANGGYLQCPCPAAPKTASITGETQPEAPSLEAKLNAFPNPTMGTLDVLFTCDGCSPDALHTLQLTDLAGKVLIRQQMQVEGGTGTMQLDLSTYAAGTYLLSLEGPNVGKLVQRIVKE